MQKVSQCLQGVGGDIYDFLEAAFPVRSSAAARACLISSLITASPAILDVIKSDFRGNTAQTVNRSVGA